MTRHHNNYTVSGKQVYIVERVMTEWNKLRGNDPLYLIGGFVFQYGYVLLIVLVVFGGGKEKYLTIRIDNPHDDFIREIKDWVKKNDKRRDN